IPHTPTTSLTPYTHLIRTNYATASMTEATLSFLGVGLPPSSPSLGTMVATGYDFLFSGEWWLVVLPSLALVALCVSLNLLADSRAEEHTSELQYRGELVCH